MNTSAHAQLKADLRRRLRQARKNLPKNERFRAEKRINHQLYRLIKRGKKMAVYEAMGSELSLHDFVQKARQRGAKPYFPLIERKKLRLWFTPCTKLSEKCGRQKQTWRQTPKIRAHRLHTIIVPLLGIDQQGFRLGQGGGYYDATLFQAARSHLPRIIGAGFSCQKVDTLPTEPHDQALRSFVSEHGWQKFSP
ncbi:5-formyltetrahydrofolate cyclo-ligase [Stenoxybacter acetivorans]|uniref:5-formyltetrahydrofolate cyclo-ligase n=1 Tax=Stenoxybacter acetivorans TaxID=422441 RepID=UPI000690E868|nr:5-formyltetrahydrofolate cyclo-ligase [Stenoxybacter acetivorans]